ncbi:MAG: Fe-S cluster assembly protein SufD [Prolixibacteraceae bacterium]|jgi:Fe-S cluster assembly protein SufD|nr:Fe-S cluster assembly protein SufD [Prolixibacteraceae bacterium]MDD4755122.1 Fe-S cluster assembly protein SufD [Prolixibacteraceae bacterium]NLO01239.1 Fe-S cluster assembly protein SufD [Bacteroidales bacterium]
MSVLVEKADLSLRYTGHYNEVKDLLMQNSADIINAGRKKALQDFVLQGIPTRVNENYKYTNLQPHFYPDFKFIHLREPAEVDLNAVFRCDVPQLDTYLAFIFNGWYYEKNHQTINLPDNVILSGLEEISFERPEYLEKYGRLADTATDPLVALNTAFAKDGYFLYVPKNTVLEKPIQIINFLQSEKDAFVTQRNFIYIEEGADVKIINCDHTLNLNKYLNNSVTEIFIGPNASFEYYALQNQHNNTTSLNSVFIHQQKDTKVTTLNSSLHGGLIRNNLNIILDGENSSANLFGMAFIDRSQHVDNFTRVIHAKPHCQSNQIYKTVLDDNSTGAFSGRIHVMRDAQKTNAFQRSNNLLLSDKAIMQAKPQLIIDADDVKCSHGATIGQIDEEALFYIRSRGIEEKQARLMLMNAFAHEVIQQIKVIPLRNRIDELVEKRLKGEVARCHECAYNCES